MVDTGLDTLTGGRIKRIKNFVGDEPFFMTYGDGVSDVDIRKLLEAHKRFGKLATLTAVKPEGRFGMMDMTGNRIDAFRACSTILTATLPCLSANRWRNSRRTDSSWPSSTTASGSAWIRCGTKSAWKSSGPVDKPLGRYGTDEF